MTLNKAKRLNMLTLVHHVQLNYVRLLRCVMLLSCLNALLDCDLGDEMCFHVWVSGVT